MTPKRPRQPRRPKPLAHKPAKIITRSIVGQRLDVHTSTVRRWERTGVLHPQVTPNGVHVFDPVEVEQLAASRRREHATPTGGELAARSLELFRDGHSVSEVVIATRQPLNVVRRLYRLHCGEGDDLMIPATIRRRLEEIVGRRLTAEDLLSVVERLRSRTNGHGLET